MSRRAWWPWVLVGGLFLSLAVCLRALRAAERALGEERRRVRVLSAELEPLRAELERATLRFEQQNGDRVRSVPELWPDEAASEAQNAVRAACAPAPCAADGKTVPQRPEQTTPPPPTTRTMRTMPTRDESMAELRSESGRVEVAPGGPMAPIAY